jgi:MraZ protein
MLRGNSPAKVDDKGRIKIPTTFRRFIEEQYGRECFVTSHTGDCVRVYPLPVWIGLEKKIQSLPSTHPTVARFLNFVNYYGQTAAIDDQGRLLIHPLARQKCGINGEVAVLGHQQVLDIWNREKFEALLAAGPLNDQDWQILASLGI